MDTNLEPQPSATPESELTPIEQEILDEYAKLVGNLDNVPLTSLFPSTSHYPDRVY
jgi:hypothetical protein